MSTTVGVGRTTVSVISSVDAEYITEGFGSTPNLYLLPSFIQLLTTIGNNWRTWII